MNLEDLNVFMSQNIFGGIAGRSFERKRLRDFYGSQVGEVA